MSVPHGLPALSDEIFWTLMTRADELGIRLEATPQGITWETSPGYRHQEICSEVLRSISATQGSSCGCHSVLDVAIRFPSGVVKRPDLSIFCERPLEEEGFVRRVPEAVVEVVNLGYEAKDLIAGPPLYLENGVGEIVVVDRFNGELHIFRAEGEEVFSLPHEVELRCGCRMRA
ncbi:MAG TPA: Uma2 family endonuclease [Fimbriimonadaceae bacterium]|nr:Uma2 family endonuclease [Fimbriimonadaceae bacterium]